MSDSHQPEDIAAYNESSLKALVRAVRLSQGQFRLILARCNYGALRDRLVQRLRELSPVKIRELLLPESVKTLYTTIKAELGDEIPQALMVFGLESVHDLRTVLTSSNYIREEFSKNFPFPLMLWVNDEVLRKLLRLAPDLESWATSVKFSLTNDYLLNFLRQKTDEIFADDLTPNLENCFEIEAAWKDLQSRGQVLEPDLEASLEFVRGLDDLVNNQIDAAIEHYQKSLRFWQRINYLERQGILLLDIALCHYRKAEQHRAESQRYWEQARDYLQQCLSIFEQAQRPDLVANHISQLGEVLRRLQAWEELQVLAEKALKLHQNNDEPLQLAQDYGFLAEVALEQSRWHEANQLAQQALQTLSTLPNLWPPAEGLYQFLLGRSQQHLGQVQEALHNLEQARQESIPQFNPQLYINILGELRELYFQQGEYLKAFEIKRERRLSEYQYGSQAFAGASILAPKQQVINSALAQTDQSAIVVREIVASGRERDIKRLIERISSTNQKLIVIHGESGVGKSSILKAGLVPALKQQAIGERDALPVLVRVYTNWVRELGRAIAEELEEIREVKLPKPLDSVAAISEQLRKNADGNLLTVLIFDQFEEFFFVCTDKPERQTFFEFLRDCLNIGFVKVILSLRKDYLHYLLESEQAINLDAINNNILDKDIRYPLINFSPDEAKAVIQSLTERSQFYLQPKLIDELVRDLAGKFGEVRPIELQVVGAQLQADNITTLADYQHYGSKEKLVEKWLEAVVKDCGAENEQAAQLVLYFLTDDKDTRPLKTRAELVTDLETVDLTSEVDKLDLLLQILVGSGLVLKIPDAPADRYQLVHDYLVSFIRQSQRAREVEERKKEKEQRQLTVSKLNEALKQQIVTENRLKEVIKQRLRNANLLGATFLLFALIAGGFGLRAAIGETNARLSDLSASSEVLVTSNKQFEALLESLKVGQQLKQSLGATADTQMRVVTALEQAVYGVREYNRLEKHTDWVSSVSFSPDGKTIASASKDNTIKLWKADGTLYKNLDRTVGGHTAGVYSVSFSPNGKMIASASEDKTVKLWSSNGVLLQTLSGHSKRVSGVSFSPDSQMVASASWDHTVKIWGVNGVLLKTLKGHSHKVWGVSFSPDGQTLASASADGTVKLWRTQDGKELQTLKASNQPVTSVSFSPDGQILASASWDKTVKLWRRDRPGGFQNLPYQTLQGHSSEVLNVSFSPNGQMIASASRDNTVKLWSRDGTLLNTLRGHGNLVQCVSFSPDSKTIASASADNTVKLWHRDKLPLKFLQGHTQLVNNLSFSPDGKAIATASQDETVKLWSADGRVLRTLSGHQGSVNAVSFSPNSQTLASASEDKTVKLWNKEGRVIHTLSGHQDSVNAVSFSFDGQMIASASDDKTVKLWSKNGVLQETLLGHKNSVNAVSFSPDGRMIASASDDKTVKLWRRDGTLITTLTGHNDAVNWVSFSPDGQMIASASGDGTVKLWRTSDGVVQHTLKGHNGSVYWVSFSPDGKTIVSASKDKTIKLWSLDGNLIATLQGHTDTVFGASFSPDGKVLASASRDRTVILWNLDLDNLLAKGCSWLHDYLKNNSEGQKINKASLQEIRPLCHY